MSYMRTLFKESVFSRSRIVCSVCVEKFDSLELAHYDILWSKFEKEGVLHVLVNTLNYWYGDQINKV